jgi:RHS repeat-associated protein
MGISCLRSAELRGARTAGCYNRGYNSRLQPLTIRAQSAGTDLLDLAYDFGLGTADNGDVKAIVNNRDNTRTQYFDYDALNRIDLANTQASSGVNAWGQAFGYDPWGNLTSVTVTQGSAPALNVGVNTNNQLAGSPYSYDAAGNMLTDAVNTYTWNAEGKMASTSGAFGSANYLYDGDGRRVEKSNGKLYWYGADGNVLAESDASGNISDEYIFFGGKRIARIDSQGNVDYYLADSLGSSRVVTDSNGNILDDCDFLPFGDERCVASSSGNAYKFTGKERDSESGLDNFGARYYSSQFGRMMSPDPVFASSAHLADPQTWNMYAYAGNNPITNTDPTGLYCVQDTIGNWYDDGNGGESCAQADAGDLAEQQNPGTVVEGKAGNVAEAVGVNAVIGVYNLIAGNLNTASTLDTFGQYSLNLPHIQTGSGIAANIGAIAPLVGAALIGPEGEGGEAGDVIKIAEGRLTKVLEAHTVGGRLVTAVKSIFDNPDEVRGLIKAAGSVSPTLQAGGNFERVVDAGRIIGTGATTGQRTSIYTVITDAAGNLITAFPGTPTRP